MAAGVGLWAHFAAAQGVNSPINYEEEEHDPNARGLGAADIPDFDPADDPADGDSAGPGRRRPTQDMEWVDGQWVQAAERDFSTPDGMLAWIRQYADRHQNALVVSTTKRFLKEFPGDARAEEAMLLAGEAEMRRERYWQAYGWFERQLDAYSAGEFSARAIQREYEVAEAFLAGKWRLVWGFLPLPAKTEGIDILMKIVDRAPGSAIGEKSMMTVADFYFDRRDYLEAAQAYDRYQELFKSSPRLAYVTYRAAMATLGTFHSTGHDETPLIDAEQRFTRFARRFPRDAQAAEVNKLLVTIRELRGRKSFETGEYYRQVNRAESAAIYYDRTVNDFSDTPWGEQSAAARANLGEVRRQPPAGKAIPPPGLPMVPPPPVAPMGVIMDPSTPTDEPLDKVYDEDQPSDELPPDEEPPTAESATERIEELP